MGDYCLRFPGFVIRHFREGDFIFRIDPCSIPLEVCGKVSAVFECPLILIIEMDSIKYAFMRDFDEFFGVFSQESEQESSAFRIVPLVCGFAVRVDRATFILRDTEKKHVDYPDEFEAVVQRPCSDVHGGSPWKRAGRVRKVNGFHHTTFVLT